MDCERENQECISLFWKLWNDALSEISKNPVYTFNRKGWCMDEAGANWSAIEEVFGSEALSKCKSCEFHFKDCRNRHKRVLSTQEEKDKFTELTDRMLYATTTSTYQKYLMELLNFIDEVRRPNLTVSHGLTGGMIGGAIYFELVAQPTIPQTRILRK